MILKQGYKPIIFTLILAFLFDIFLSDFISNILYITVFILLFIYRDIKRDNFLASKFDILAPIDGKVIAIDDNKIYIDISLCNMALFKVPFDCKYEISYKKGLNLDSSSYMAKNLNEKAIIKFNDIKMTLISGICNFAFNFSKSKDKALQNEEIGLFLQGLLIIEINEFYKIDVNLNDNIYSSKTILAKHSDINI